MKNILWIGGIYAASPVGTAAYSAAFPVLALGPVGRGRNFVLPAAGRPGLRRPREGRLEQADKTERLLGIVYWIRKVMSAIFAAAVFHLAVIVLAGVFPIPGLVRGLAALVLIVTCICGVLLLWRAGKPEEETAASEEFREPGEDA